MEDRYKESKEKAKAIVSKASAVSLTSDMWTSINTDAYLAVTCHFIDANTSLHSDVSEAHTAENLAKVKAALMSVRGITHKVTCLVTNGAASMGACAKELLTKTLRCLTSGQNLGR